jgi:hypothetical protein
VATAGVTIALPYLPVASGFGLTGLPMAVLASMILITVAYIGLTEILKMRWKSILITSSATGVV